MINSIIKKEINKLVDQLETVLEEAKSAKANAKEALIISQETAAESLKLSQKIESVKELLQEVDTCAQPLLLT